MGARHVAYPAEGGAGSFHRDRPFPGRRGRWVACRTACCQGCARSGCEPTACAHLARRQVAGEFGTRLAVVGPEDQRPGCRQDGADQE